ncbi:MAG: c-type cytochrome [Gemmataceae bacterium]|nr:c-type cytochrome [Gemmata sp.]MDW8196568.1 c-type cytochrome [Gemmataceae bacterium]
MVAAALLAAVPIGTGCGTPAANYPAQLVFPPRSDRLVLQLPMQPPPKENTAGRLDEEIAALDAYGGRTVEPRSLAETARNALDQFLTETFGTPAEPRTISATLKLTREHLLEGGRLYKTKCFDCHNLTGDGRGAKSGQFVVPFPRDYRQGAFKFVTSGAGLKPRRADLLRTIHNGLPGTAMPPFSLLQPGERDLLAGYVMFLSIRGQIEFEGLCAIAEGRSFQPAERLAALVREWEAADAAPPLPSPPDDGDYESPTYHEAVRRGYQLFTAKRENSCISCHEDFGRKPVLRYEVWGTVAKPANFTETTLKGGKEPHDVYARIRFGIAPVGMPAHPPSQYTEREVWDLVRFVTSIPYPVRLPPDVRDAIYPNPE